MSLVHDALQKAEREKMRKAGLQPAPAPKPSQPFIPGRPPPGDSAPIPHSAVSQPKVDPFAALVLDAPAQKKSSPLLPMLIGIVAMVALVAIAFLVTLAASNFSVSSSAGQPRTAAAPAAPVQPAPAHATAPPIAPATEPATAAAKPPPPGSVVSGFQLTGIMPNAEGQYLAIINGNIVSPSSAVDGATVKSIDRNAVTLDLNGKEIVLRLM